MRNQIIICLFLIPYYTFAQLEYRFGITSGITNYITKTDALFSKSGIGYYVGLVTSAQFNERSELFIEMNFNNHFVKFIGREEKISNPEEIKFNLQNFSIPIFYDYSYFIYKDLKLGVNAGSIVTFIYDYQTVDDSKYEYLLDPLYATPYDLKFDTRNEEVSFNMFVSIGLSAQYDFLMANLRYNYGITDPYRNAPFVSPITEIKGRDYYISFSLTFLLYEY